MKLPVLSFFTLKKKKQFRMVHLIVQYFFLMNYQIKSSYNLAVGKILVSPVKVTCAPNSTR